MNPPKITLPRGNVLLVGAGALPVALLPGWVLYLRQLYGWQVRVCLTRSATGLVASDALAAISGRPVLGPEWRPAGGTVEHREAAEWADLVIVIPATGAFIAKCAAGITDSLALATVGFTEAPVFIVPSLGGPRLRAKAVQRNLAALEEDGYHVLPTETGTSAHTGADDLGAMPSIFTVLRTIAESGAVHAGGAEPEPHAAAETAEGAA
ncbi:hypothetical protein O4J56_17960 [Nocardiopsis sp. RSe5-2]|uniref:Flavoprotein domain-containing protein n=1 Tax=Nocardiopsis endophytica TaxID=3018445 RepID=A0ABT4U6G1_9ACTN|nr:flavoprotein [Nocardiopsis endophytica]MDA2812534.1 hypothetical protein [Nocardiopsis endophytica]